MDNDVVAAESESEKEEGMNMTKAAESSDDATKEAREEESETARADENGGGDHTTTDPQVEVTGGKEVDAIGTAEEGKTNEEDESKATTLYEEKKEDVAVTEKVMDVDNGTQNEAGETSEPARKKARSVDSKQSNDSDTNRLDISAAAATAQNKDNVPANNDEPTCDSPQLNNDMKDEEERNTEKPFSVNEEGVDSQDEENDEEKEKEKESRKNTEKKEFITQVEIAPRPDTNSAITELSQEVATANHGTTSSTREADEVPSSKSARPTSGRRLTFPEKLMELLNSEDAQSAMCWIQVGSAFALHQILFMKNILPLHFEGTKFESFTRKLNRWGFKRIAGEGIPDNAFAYSHHLFKRDFPELCRGMSGGKKVEQDFSHLIRYRELARRFQDGAPPNFAAIGAGSLSSGAMGSEIGGNIGSSAMGGGMGSIMGSNAMGGGMGNAMGGGMGGLGGRFAGLHSGDTLQSLEVENLLLERHIGLGSGAGGSEREFAIREALLRQEATAVREQRLEQQLIMERMLREQQGGGSIGNSDGDNRRAAFFAREHQGQALHGGGGADRLFHARDGLGGIGRSGGNEMDHRHLQMLAERHAMQDRQVRHDRMAFFGGPGQGSFMGNGSGGMYPQHMSDRSEFMLREEGEAATRIRIERRLMHEAAMREQQGYSAMGGGGVNGGRFGGGR